MKRLLFVKGSPRGTNSDSGKVADAFLAERTDKAVDTIDLWKENLPEFDGDKALAKMTVITGGSLTGATRTAWDEIAGIAERFTSADEYLFTVPMWNGGIPYRLKLYIDLITQPGMLFGFDPATGYSGLLKGKRATVIYTSGVFSPGVAQAFGSDFHSTYFNDWLRFIGINDVTEIRFQPTLLTADPAAALKTAIALAKSTAAQI